MAQNGTVTDDRRRQVDLGFLDSLRLSLEIGYCGVLRNEIARFGDRLAMSPDEDIRDEYAKITRRAQEAFQIEAVHGRGSLLQLRHPVVKDLIGIKVPRRPPIIEPEEIEAARRYGSIKRRVRG